MSSSSWSSSSSSSSNPPSLCEGHQTRNWLELPRDVTATILLKLGTIEILTSAQWVCSSWRNICKDPLMWRTIDMPNKVEDLCDRYDHFECMCRHAIDRSCGHLVDINIEYFGTDDLLKYITDRTSHLRRLRLVYCFMLSDEGLSKIAGELPLLEELDLSPTHLSKDLLEVIGRCCPILKSLKYNTEGYRPPPHIECDEQAFAIAETMPELRHLQLFGNTLTNAGLLAILNGCPHLESLDLRQCFNVNLEGILGSRSVEKIKDLRLPYDPTNDYPFEAELFEVDLGPPVEDYHPLGISDVEFLSDNDYDFDDDDD